MSHDWILPIDARNATETPDALCNNFAWNFELIIIHYLDPPPVMSWWSLWGVMAANCAIHDELDGWTLGECLVGDNTQMDMLFWSFLHNPMNAFCSR